MLRSFSSGVSGLRSHQTMLDVTGNNIANVNTTGFKGSSTRFQDTLSQVTQAAGAPQQQVGGTNPAQVGLGVQVASIGLNMTQGAMQSTGRATDMTISGDGFFVVHRDGQEYYTRAGAFDWDAQGRLVTPDGSIVQGTAGDLTLPQNRDDIVAYRISPDGSLVGTLDDGGQEVLGQIQLATFVNPAGLEKAGDSRYMATANSGQAQFGEPSEGGFGSLATGVLEMSNVDLSQEFTNLIIAQRGFQANSRVITTSDELLGELVNLKR